MISGIVSKFSSGGGELVAHSGKPLNALPLGQPLRIVHLEDEPETIYAQLIAEELYPGMRLLVLESSRSRVRFWADGDEHVEALFDGLECLGQLTGNSRLPVAAQALHHIGKTFTDSMTGLIENQGAWLGVQCLQALAARGGARGQESLEHKAVCRQS